MANFHRWHAIFALLSLAANAPPVFATDEISRKPFQLYIEHNCGSDVCAFNFKIPQTAVRTFEMSRAE